MHHVPDGTTIGVRLSKRERLGRPSDDREVEQDHETTSVVVTLFRTKNMSNVGLERTVVAKVLTVLSRYANLATDGLGLIFVVRTPVRRVGLAMTIPALDGLNLQVITHLPNFPLILGKLSLDLGFITQLLPSVLITPKNQTPMGVWVRIISTMEMAITQLNKLHVVLWRAVVVPHPVHDLT
jgi:hypothetical protein